MQRLEVSIAVRPIYESLGVKRLKIAEFRTPTPQDVEKKGSKILKLPRLAIVLH